MSGQTPAVRLTRPDGVTLWWDVEIPAAGTGGRPVVLVPGRGDSTDLFPRLVSESLVGAGLPVVRYDPRDTGLSDDGGDDYSLVTMADDALAIAEAAAGPGPVHWLGVSMAGLQLVDLAVRAPARVASLTFVSAFSPDPEAGFGEFFFDGLPDDPTEAYLVSMGAIDDDDRAWAVRHVAEAADRAPTRPEASAAHMAAVGRAPWPTLDDLARVHAPTLVVHGTDDRTLPLAHAAALGNGIAGAEILVRDGMGHLPRPADWEVIAREVIVQAVSTQ